MKSLDFAVKVLLEHMNQYGMCVVDNFLGFERYLVYELFFCTLFCPKFLSLFIRYLDFSEFRSRKPKMDR